MPHFIIECSENVLQLKSANEIMQTVYRCAEATGLFVENDIKVRIRPFTLFMVGIGKQDFVHIFAFIMEGRTIEQKQNLAYDIITKPNELLTCVSILSISVADFEKAIYCNKALIHPENTTGDRHFAPSKNG